MGDAGFFYYLCVMFPRKKKNRTGSISVVVIDKSHGGYKEVKSFGVVKTDEEADLLMAEASEWIRTAHGQRVLDFAGSSVRQAERLEVERVLGNISSVVLNGPQLILNQVYDSIGFNRIRDEVLRHLVIARICRPGSKAATADYLKSYFHEDVSLDQIYRYMDKLYNTQRETVQQISVEHTRKVLGGSIGLMFYDVTSLYFETGIQDELRTNGFSKDGKTAESQIILGLLVSADGYPLSYSVFNGAQYEGRTMIPIIDDFIQRFNIKDFVVVADSGLLNKTNVELLRQAGYKYILGARIKKEPAKTIEWILAQEKVSGAYHEYTRENGERLVLGYSEQRAKKDAHNRVKGIERLRKAYSSGVLTKASINKRGYNNFLSISKDVKVVINEQEIENDAKWDGLKGYVTNTDLDAEKVVAQYHSLWCVERAFRVTKGNLEARPIFHFTEKRIEAHICICFIAYKVYKELQRIIALHGGIGLSVDKVIDIAMTIPTIKIRMPYNGEERIQTLFLTDKHRQIKPLFDIKEILKEEWRG